MTVERALRLTAGIVVGTSLLLGLYHSEYWFLLTGFVAINLIQSAFTNVCPAKSVYEALGMKSCDVDDHSEGSATKQQTV